MKIHHLITLLSILQFLCFTKTDKGLPVSILSIIIGHISNITDSSVLVGAQIIFNGNGEITERGEIYRTEPHLTFNNAKIDNVLN